MQGSRALGHHLSVPKAPVWLLSTCRFAQLHQSTMSLVRKSHSQVFRSSLETFIAMTGPVVAGFLLREVGPVFPSHTALPTAVPSGISTTEGPDECAWEQQLDPWPCCVLWQSAPCAMRVSAGDSVQRSGCHNPVHRVPRTTPKGAGLAGSAKLPFWGCAGGEARLSLELKVPRAPSGHFLRQER